MRITRMQLRSIIKKEKFKLQEYGGRPYDPTVPGDQQLQADLLNPPPGGDPEWEAQLDEMADEIGDRAAGGYEPSMDGTPEQYADMIINLYLDYPPPPLDKMEHLKFVLTNYSYYVKKKILEYIRMMTEGKKMNISKRQLRRIIREQVDEAPWAERYPPEDPVADDALQSHRKDIVNMFLDDTINYVRQDIVVEHAPGLAGMTMADFLQAAADKARRQDASELVSDYGV